MRGPLHDLHERLGARFTEFSGFDMPVMYTGIKAEHEAVRNAAGLFDVSHMSNLRIEGPDATELVSFCTVADAAKVKPDHGVYTCIPRHDGTILDDTIFYKIGDEAYYMVPNAGMNTAVKDHIEAHRGTRNADVIDVSRDTCIFALQGPNAAAVLAKVTEAVPDAPRFAAHLREIAGARTWVTTTGYTGEDGYELFVDADAGATVFEALLDAGADDGLVPCGLGARDTLRLEMGYALAGHEFAGGKTPLEAGLGWTVKWDHDFVGKQALVTQKEAGGYPRLVGLQVTGRGGVPREGMSVVTRDGAAAGTVTSGTMSPSLGHGIALAYVSEGLHKSGTELAIHIRNRAVDCLVTRPPFLK